MKSNLGREFGSSVIHKATSYDIVAREYYDEIRHPTCADFRSAARAYLTKLFSYGSPRGRVADIGCGRSLIAEFITHNLVLIDGSREMLAYNAPPTQQRLINVEEDSFGNAEFDWVFAVLGDPYNSLAAWKHIREALKSGGRCVFIVPSFSWAGAFRSAETQEKANFAAFVTSNGTRAYLPSVILPKEKQKVLIQEAGLKFVRLDYVNASVLPFIRSPKISKFCSNEDAILDIYHVTKES